MSEPLPFSETPIHPDRFRHDPLAQAIRAGLHDGLLKPEWRARPDRRPYAGHCYVATEAYVHLSGGRDAGWLGVVVQHEGGTHWWAENRLSGARVDLTAEQFRTPPPYQQGRGCGFQGKPGQPSGRAQQLIKAVRAAG